MFSIAHCRLRESMRRTWFCDFPLWCFFLPVHVQHGVHAWACRELQVHAAQKGQRGEKKKNREGNREKRTYVINRINRMGAYISLHPPSATTDIPGGFHASEAAYHLCRHNTGKSGKTPTHTVHWHAYRLLLKCSKNRCNLCRLDRCAWYNKYTWNTVQ